MNNDFIKLTPIQRQLYRTLFKKSFYEFVKYFWDCIEDRTYVDGILVEYYCEMAQYLCRWWIPYEEKQIDIPKYDPNTTNLIDVRGDQRNVCINIPPLKTFKIRSFKYNARLLDMAT